MRLLYGHDRDVANWGLSKMPPMFGDMPFESAGPYVAIGVISEDGELVAATVFNQYDAPCKTIRVHLASDSPRWATRRIIGKILAYPFLQLKLNKVWGVTPAYMTRVLRFNRAIGFSEEGRLRHQFGIGHHGVFTGMMATEYERLYLRGGITSDFMNQQKTVFDNAGRRKAA